MSKYKVALTFLCLTGLSEVFGVRQVTYRCKKDWWKFEDRCYRVLNNQFLVKPYQMDECANSNSSLFVPSSPKEFNAVSSYMSSLGWVSTPTNPIASPIGTVWVGCDDEEEEGTFQCTDGTTFNSTSEWWDVNESSNDASTNCVFYDVQYAKLRDTPCSNSHQALCEANATLYKVSGDFGLISGPDGAHLKGYCLKGHTMFSAKVAGLVQCAGLCLSREACLSFNWEEKPGNCEINRNTSSAAGANSMERREGCNYFEPGE